MRWLLVNLLLTVLLRFIAHGSEEAVEVQPGGVPRDAQCLDSYSTELQRLRQEAADRKAVILGLVVRTAL